MSKDNIKFKFEVGDEVKISSDGRIGNILTILYDSDNGLRYRVTMNSVNFVTNEVIKGAITLSEDELEGVEK